MAVLLYYCKVGVIIPEQNLFASSVEHEKFLEVEARQSLLSLMSLIYKGTLYSLSTGKVLEGVWLARGKFMGCEGQFKQPADGVQNRHGTFLPLSPSNRTLKKEKRKKSTITKETKLLFKTI